MTSAPQAVRTAAGNGAATVHSEKLPLFARAANSVSYAAGRPSAFMLCCLAIVVWGVTGPLFHYSDTWQLVINTGTTIITFLMVFLIQNTQNRDGAALQAKLDELIRVTTAARNDLMAAEKLPEKELAQIREDGARAAEDDAGG
jgi:low affinity Fe/Cu permease